ncbi:UDP-N-acetylmuramate dehydrogenase [Candidatus Saccharibacteria bacterium]|nr:UDP-N-acetylmuramate dehydrogenase [Candidatus Saccharibacteria bacterium]
MKVNENILISSLTTMRLGGPARYVIEVEQPSDVPDAYGFARQYQLPTFILGYGANTLGHDEGFNGVIIINRMRGITEIDPSTINIMGGEYWDNVVDYACKRNLTGIEAMSKIPGLAGAAPVQNIGAYGQDISDTLVSIEAYDSATDTFVTLSRDDLQFSYRKSILNTTAKNRYFVISITLSLHEGTMPRPFYTSMEKYIADHDLTDFSPQGIRNIVSTIRAEKLPDPLEKASSGSFFHNIYLNEQDAEIAAEKGYPVRHGNDGHKINAAWLIEQCGFKGKLLHGIRVSDKSALVLINESATSYNDLAKARGEITGKVYDKFGFWLEQEPVEIQ